MGEDEPVGRHLQISFKHKYIFTIAAYR